MTPALESKSGEGNCCLEPGGMHAGTHEPPLAPGAFIRHPDLQMRRAGAGSGLLEKTFERFKKNLLVFCLTVKNMCSCWETWQTDSKEKEKAI